MKRGEVPRLDVSLEIADHEAAVRKLLDWGDMPLPETADFDG